MKSKFLFAPCTVFLLSLGVLTAKACDTSSPSGKESLSSFGTLTTYKDKSTNSLRIFLTPSTNSQKNSLSLEEVIKMSNDFNTTEAWISMEFPKKLNLTEKDYAAFDEAHQIVSIHPARNGNISICIQKTAQLTSKDIQTEMKNLTDFLSSKGIDLKDSVINYVRFKIPLESPSK